MADTTARQTHAAAVDLDQPETLAVAAPTTDRLALAFKPGRPALICYLPLGDPETGDGLPELYRDCGVDILEWLHAAPCSV